MLNITDNQVEQTIPAFFRLGFRPLFLSAVIFSLLAISLWIASFSAWITFQPYGGVLWWHGHEMIFGFVSAVIVGFLLTAVQNWTGSLGLRSWRLVGLCLVWLIARVLLLNQFTSSVMELITMITDIAFLPLAAYFLAKPILRVKQYRNLFFVPVLLLLALSNVASHLALHKVININWTLSANYAFNAAVLLITLIMTVMGGRVLPMFTANGTGTVKATSIKWLDYSCLASTWLLTLCFLFNLSGVADFQPWLAVIAGFAGVSNLLRWARWRFAKTLKVPLVWSLQLAYLFIPLTHLMLAFHWFTGWFSFSSVLHGYTLGAMANMILAMMSRVSLGHTGRPLQVKPILTCAFLLIASAALIRFIGVNLAPQSPVLALQISGLCWLASYGIFTWLYWPVLTKPRVDGRPG
jgi:uncharacterized protein involved in response to NO